jgi:predicted phosphodiesterase
MRLAILSDIHDQVSHLKQVLARLRPLAPDAIVLCGDITRSEALLAARLPGLPLAFCLGNCDRGEAARLKATAAAHGLGAWGDLGIWDLGPDERPVAFSHFPAIARKAAASGLYRAVFYGHTHRRALESLEGPGELGACLLANPGDIEGRYGRPGALCWDSLSGSIDWV